MSKEEEEREEGESALEKVANQQQKEVERIVKKKIKRNKIFDIFYLNLLYILCVMSQKAPTTSSYMNEGASNPARHGFYA